MFQPRMTSPLSASNFRTFVLLPEVAVLLIMEDLDQDRLSAVRTMLSSIWYGESQYPLNQTDEYKHDAMIAEIFGGLHSAGSLASHWD